MAFVAIKLRLYYLLIVALAVGLLFCSEVKSSVSQSYFFSVPKILHRCPLVGISRVTTCSASSLLLESPQSHNKLSSESVKLLFLPEPSVLLLILECPDCSFDGEDRVLLCKSLEGETTSSIVVPV